MKKILAVLLCLLPSLASAQIIPSLPYNLTNGTLADANQVMADFNQIVSSVNTNAANAGANTNITALTGLTTPLSPSSGGSSVYTGGASSGSLNAQTLLNPTPLGFSLVSGRRVTFIAGFTNSGPTTLNINSTGAIAVLKQSPAGLVALSGGEIVLNQGVDVWYDGTQYQLFNAAPQATVQPCTTIDYQGVAVPSGYLATDGTAKSRTTYAGLWGCIATSGVAANTTNASGAIVLSSPTSIAVGWYVGGANVTCNATVLTVTDSTHVGISINAGATGATTLTFGPYPQGDCSTTFNLPNNSGRATAQIDLTGTVLTTSCVPATTIGTNCGTQTHTLTAAQIPTLTTSSSGTNTINVTNNSNGVPFNASATSTAITTTGGSVFVPTAVSAFTAGTGAFTSSGSNSITVSGTTSGTSGSAHSIVQPIALVYKAIKT